MARTQAEIVAAQLGQQALIIAQLQADNDRLTEEKQKLEKDLNDLLTKPSSEMKESS